MLAAIPIATPDVSYVTPINSQLNISNADFGVLANDFDADSASITAEQFGNPVNGSVTLNSNGTFTFNPTAGFEGIGSFRYRVFDGANYSRVKPVSITVGSGVAQVQNGQDRTQDSFLHDGALTLSQPLGAGVSLEYRSDKNEYDAIGRVRKVFDPSGRFTESVYDVKHRIIKSISVDPDGSGPLQAPSTEYMVNDVGNVESMTDALNNVTIYGYDDLDRLTSVTLPDPDGSGSQAAPIYSMDYDAVGNIISQTDALGRVTTIEYDNLYRQETVTQPAPDVNGNQSSPVWTFQYNDQMLLDTVISPVIATTVGSVSTSVSRGYDDAGRLTSFTNRAGNTTSYGYDDLDRLTSITSPDPDGAGGVAPSVTKYNYDILSRLESVEDADNQFTNYTYDDAGQLLELKDASNNVTRFAYDGLGRMTMETDARGVTRSYNHNSTGRLVRSVDGNGKVTRFVNDGFDTSEQWYQYADAPLATVTGSNDVSINFQNVLLDTYEANFFRISADGQTTKWINMSELNSQIEAALEELESISGGVTVERAGQSRLDISFDGPTPQMTVDFFLEEEGTMVDEITYERDELYRLESVSDLNSTFDYGYTYDGLGRVTQQSEAFSGLAPDITLDIGYDAVSNRTSVEASIGSASDYLNTYSYDKLDRLTITQQQSQAGGNALTPKRVVNTYNSLGQRVYVNRYEATSNTQLGLRTLYQYDGAARLQRIQHRKVFSGSSALLHRYTYAYDGMDRIKSIHSTIDSWSYFSHDKLNQLTDANHATARPDESFTYDDTGNRTNTGYETLVDNLTTSDGIYNYGHDREGNREIRTEITTGNYDLYSWDHRNRLVSVESYNSGGTLVEQIDYKYDAFNRMIQRSHDADGAGSASPTDQYFAGFDGDNPTLEFDGSSANDLTNRNLWEGDHLIAQEDVTSLSTQGGVMWPLTDQVGTIRDIGMLNSSGTQYEIANHRAYDSFGNLTSETNASIDLDYGYTGRFTDDATGLTHHLNRWLDPATGKWLSDDPISFAAGDTNLQRYVDNEVLAYYDIDGLLAVPVVVINGDLGSGTNDEFEFPRLKDTDGRFPRLGGPKEELVVPKNATASQLKSAIEEAELSIKNRHLDNLDKTRSRLQEEYIKGNGRIPRESLEEIQGKIDSHNDRIWAERKYLQELKEARSKELQSKRLRVTNAARGGTGRRGTGMGNRARGGGGGTRMRAMGAGMGVLNVLGVVIGAGADTIRNDDTWGGWDEYFENLGKRIVEPLENFDKWEMPGYDSFGQPMA